VRVDERNTRLSYRAADSAKMNFTVADDIDDGSMNDVFVHAIKGAKATPPPYGAFDQNRYTNRPRR